MARSRNINVDIVLGLKGNGIDEAIRDTQKLGKNIQGLAGTALKAAAGFAVFKGGALFGDFARQGIADATSLERNISAIGAIFKDQAPVMLEYAENASRIGLNMNEAAGAATFLGSVIKQAGFSIDETSKMTKTLVDLSADLAITYNRDVSEALGAIAALFRGEYDPIEKFGVGMKQNEIESLKAARGLEKLTGQAEIFADVMIRYEQLILRSRDAQGAFGRQTESLYAQQQILGATFENVRMKVGLALTPALAELTMNMIPLVEALTPVLITLFRSLIPVIERLTANKDQLAQTVFGVLKVMGVFITVVANLTAHIIKHIEVYKNLAIAFGVIVIGIKAFGLMTTAVNIAANAVLILNGRLLKTVKALGLTRAAIARTGFGLIAVALGTAAVAAGALGDNLEGDIEALQQEMDAFDLSALQGEVDAAMASTEDLGDAMETTAGAAGQLKDAVGDFYRGLENEAAKQSAKLQLQSLGASEGLIQAVLGSGEEWFKVFADVTRRGAESVREVQALFARTPAGYDEAMAEFERQREEFEQFKKAAQDAGKALADFVKEFEILPTIERQMGQFERATVDQLENIEDRLKEAFDNGYLLDGSYRNLVEYARREFAVLSQIERQRDEILARRNAAEQLIQQVGDSIRQGAQLVNVLRNVQNETERVDVASVVKRTIAEASSLREFSVIVTSAVVEPIEEVVNQSQRLVSGYRDIVERTRTFVNNMKELRALGLDPTLFNELVEAGVDAGGATAEALIAGGSKTVAEVNSLFAELNALGEELGEQTAQVMYGQGELFVDGIVKGLEAQAAQLEEQAKELAQAFTSTFEEMLLAGIEAAIAAAEAALARMPRMEGMPAFTRNPAPSTVSGTPKTSIGGLTSQQLSAIAKDKQGIPSSISFSGAGMGGVTLGATPPASSRVLPTYRNPYAGAPLMSSSVTVVNTRIDEKTANRIYTRSLNSNTAPKKTNTTSLKPTKPR